MNQWNEMWYELMLIDDKKQGRERWYQFLRDEGVIHMAKKRFFRKFFDEIWRDTRREREELTEAEPFDDFWDPDWRPAR